MLLLALWISAVPMPLGQNASPSRGCDALLGQWNWFTGTTVILRDDGIVDGGPVLGRCERPNAVERRYIIRWQNGFVDTLTLSPDGRSLEGFNNLSFPVSAKRAATATSPNIDTPPAAIAIPERASSVAVVIGISNYREAEIPKVPYARSDAEIVAKYLENVAGIRKENLRVVSDDRATLSDITDAIENWLTRRVTESSTVFIYYAGHGALDPSTGDTYLVPYEGSPDSPSTRLYPTKRLYEKLEAFKAKEVVVFLDSCFSGGGRSITMRGRPIVITSTNPTADLRRVTVLAAAQGNQVSSDLDGAKHGLFTYYLLSGMRGMADSNHDGWIDLKELYDFTREKVHAAAISELNRDQTPALLGPSNLETRARALKLFRTR